MGSHRRGRRQWTAASWRKRRCRSPLPPGLVCPGTISSTHRIFGAQVARIVSSRVQISPDWLPRAHPFPLATRAMYLVKKSVENDERKRENEKN